MTHRVVDTEEEEEPKKQRVNLFQEKFLPHWAMGVLTLVWGFFQLRVGDAAVPGTLNQGFATMLGLWTAYAFKQVNESKDKKNG